MTEAFQPGSLLICEGYNCRTPGTDRVASEITRAQETLTEVSNPTSWLSEAISKTTMLKLGCSQVLHISKPLRIPKSFCSWEGICTYQHLLLETETIFV